MLNDPESTDTLHLAKAVLEACRRHKIASLVTAESCTGGLIAAALTDIPGSSDVFDRGFVTYSNQAKTDMLRIPAPMLETYGAVSREVAIAMAEGARMLAGVSNSAAIAVSGIAGPGGGTVEKPVGLVHVAALIGFHEKHPQVSHLELRLGDIGRHEIRARTVKVSFNLLLAAFEGGGQANHP